MVICRMLGVPYADHDLVQRHRAEPGEDLLGRLVARRVETGGPGSS